jgi:hypothetical protein
MSKSKVVKVYHNRLVELSTGDRVTNTYGKKGTVLRLCNEKAGVRWDEPNKQGKQIAYFGYTGILVNKGTYKAENENLPQAEEKEAARKKAVRHARKVIDTARRKEYEKTVMAPTGVHWVAPKPKPVRVRQEVEAAIKLPCPRPAGWVIAPPQKEQ